MKQDHLRKPKGHSPAPEPTGAPQDAPGWRPVHTGATAERRVSLEPCRRRDARIFATGCVATTFIDPVWDPVTNETCYNECDEDAVVNLSRRGAALRCERPPHIGTRLLLSFRTPEGAPIEVIGRTCWTRVEFVPGEHGARAIAAIGVEFVGASDTSFDRYERWLADLAGNDNAFVARPPALG